MKAYVLIKIQSGEIVDAIRQLRKVPGVVAADMTFGPYDAVAVVEAKDLNALGLTVAAGVQPVVGVKETLTCLVIDIA
ncbi:MAG: Lrp/AsnC family transcriptional regulator [Chloroflexi bacterium]|nr:Lrp/AsnC family transcriptional regulator [Chloroflexota bacterium]